MSQPFHYRRNVQFAETDMAGVMHFSNYFRLMEEAEHALWRSLGLSVHMSAADGGPAISFPRVEVSCEYSAPARFEDVLELSVRVLRVAGKVVEFEITFRRDNVDVARGRMITVCCATEHGRFRAVPIPQHIIEKLRAVGAPVADVPQEG